MFLAHPDSSHQDTEGGGTTAPNDSLTNSILQDLDLRAAAAENEDAQQHAVDRMFFGNNNNNMTDSSDSSNSNRKDTMDMRTANNKTMDGGTVLAIDPEDIEIAVLTQEKIAESDSSESSYAPDQETLLKQIPFVSMFRGSANYIANHRHTVAVYHIPGGLLQNEVVLRDLMNDVALTWLLGMKLVIVVGCRQQIEQRLKSQNQQLQLQQEQQPQQDANGVPVPATGAEFHAAPPQLGLDDVDHTHGLRVTDAPTLRIVKEEAGYVRFEVERQLARSLRMQGSGGTSSSDNHKLKPGASSSPNSNNANGSRKDKQGYYAGNVVSGQLLLGATLWYTGWYRLPVHGFRPTRRNGKDPQTPRQPRHLPVDDARGESFGRGLQCEFRIAGGHRGRGTGSEQGRLL